MNSAKHLSVSSAATVHGVDVLQLILPMLTCQTGSQAIQHQGPVTDMIMCSNIIRLLKHLVFFLAVLLQWPCFIVYRFNSQMN